MNKRESKPEIKPLQDKKTFPFGSRAGQVIETCIDIRYMKWAYDNNLFKSSWREALENRLKELGEIKVESKNPQLVYSTREVNKK